MISVQLVMQFALTVRPPRWPVLAASCSSALQHLVALQLPQLEALKHTHSATIVDARLHALDDSNTTDS